MSAWFRGKTPTEKTVLILDVENGSVGGALVRISPHAAPKLFGETRQHIAIPHTRVAAELLYEIERAARGVIGRLSETASRVRAHPATASMGTISSGALFLAAPWGVPDLAAATPQLRKPVTDLLENALGERFAKLPLSFHTAAGAALSGAHRVLAQEEPYLLCIITGEVTELLLVADGKVAGYATLPLGRHLPVRTLRTHGLFSEHEARSALRAEAAYANAPLSAAALHYAEAFAESAAELLGTQPVATVYLLTHEPEGQWFAQALSQSEAMEPVFPNGGTVRVIKPSHAMPHVAAHAARPDTTLMLQALFTDALT